MSVCDSDTSLFVRLSPLSFNPCFSGCRSAIRLTSFVIFDHRCFNPCFSGCRSAIFLELSYQLMNINVSILVLVDVGLRLSSAYRPDPSINVSILVLVDVGLRFAIRDHPMG